MKNVLITGGKGFLGRNLKEGLGSNYHVFAPGHQELDILDLDQLFRYITGNKIDIIIHAAIHVPMFNGPEHEMLNDMIMFWNLEKISPLVEKIIYFGSGAEFDKRFDITDVTEDDFGKRIPGTEYGLAKYSMNKAAGTSKNIYNLRLFGIFGKYELWDIKFLSNLCCKAMYDLPLTIRRDCNFNFVYVDDLIPVIDWFISHDIKYHDYNFCHDLNYKLSELAGMVNTISGKNLEIKLLSSERNLDYTASNQRLHEEIPMLKITDMQTALSRLYDHYRSIMDQIDLSVLEKTR